jgi:hypothetical protein
VGSLTWLGYSALDRIQRPRCRRTPFDPCPALRARIGRFVEGLEAWPIQYTTSGITVCSAVSLRPAWVAIRERCTGDLRNLIKRPYCGLCVHRVLSLP